MSRSFSNGTVSFDPQAVVDIFSFSTAQWSVSSYRLREARGSLVAVALGSVAVFAGGASRDPPTALRETDMVDIYDETSNAWTNTLLSVPRVHFAGAGAGTKVIFAGGSYELCLELLLREKKLSIAGPGTRASSTQLWTFTTSPRKLGRRQCFKPVKHALVLRLLGLPQRLYLLAASTILLLRALLTISSISTTWNYYTVADADIYDVTTGTWAAASLSVPRRHMACGAVNGQVVFAGGVFDNTTDRTTVPDVDIYDVLTSEWKSTSSGTAGRLRRAAAGSAISVVCDRLLIASDGTSNIDIYDPRDETWTANDIPNVNSFNSRKDLAAVGRGDYAFLAGGYVH